MFSIIKAYAVKNLCYIKAQKMTPKGIVVHSTGANNPNLKRYVDAPQEVGVNTYGNHWNTAKPGGRKVCVHAFIGYDKNKVIRVAEILPLDICCWGVGSGKKGSCNFNPAYIQFEICEDSLQDESYYKKVFTTAAEYCAHLCKQYNISVDNIVGHCEAYRLGYGCNHSDPEHWMKRFGENMKDFRQKVKEILESDEKEIIKVPVGFTINGPLEIHKGDLVSIINGATYYNGKPIPNWVQTQRWYVKSEPTGSRVVIDKSENGKHSICSPVDKKYLVKIQATEEVLSQNNECVSYKCPYLVKVNSSNIYDGVGPNNIKTGEIKNKGVYTIVEEKTDLSGIKWGRLKSGVGWIALDEGAVSRI